MHSGWWSLSTWADLGTIWSGIAVLGAFVLGLHHRIMHKIDERFDVQGRKSDVGIKLSIRSHQRLDGAGMADVPNGRSWVSVVVDTPEEPLLR